MTEERSHVAATAVRLLGGASVGDPEAVARLDEMLPALRAAAESGHVQAQEVLGGVLLEFKENPTEAAVWFARSASQGSAVGKRSLGHLHTEGFGVDKDLVKAERLFAEAADTGDAVAQFNLAQLWWGRRDPQSVLAMLRAAAAGGVVDARLPLGDLLAALDRDPEALESYLQAAEAGHDKAMHVVACWYRDGIVGEPDRVEALTWFFRLIATGDADPLHEALLMARDMSDDDILRAGELSGQHGYARATVETTAKYR
ncbi:tetratricopeptide repeat protein [Streptomyces sp. NPDC059828]|uniref:tetratricopeptide repeat protein n=1 Tax=Streptomyces sp. NPDC059828 TaxID=3346965 RepID=UPI0036472550